MKTRPEAAQALRKFICRVCGLIYDEARGDADSGLAAGTRFEDIPDDWACPICGVGKADFEPWVPQPTPARVARRPGGAADSTARAARAPRAAQGVVIVGAGHAGWAVAQALRQADAELPITVLSACSGDVYDKPQLSVAVARGLDPQALVREPAAHAAARLDVRLRCDTQAIAIEPAARRLRTTRGTLRYRQLVLAHGAQAALPTVLRHPAVWRINDLTSYQRLRQVLASGPQRLAIVGAGLVGCELADDLASAGHRILLIDPHAQPLAAQVPAAVGRRLLVAWKDLPIEFLDSASVDALDTAELGGWRLRLSDGRVIEADQVIAATGLRTPTRLASSAALAYDAAAGGVTVDAHTGATSVPGIFALGDCVVVEGRASRYIEPIGRQARAIAAAITGRGAVAGAAPIEPVLRVKTTHLPITITGSSTAPASDWEVDQDDGRMLRLVRRNRAGEVVARVSAGRAGAGA